MGSGVRGWGPCGGGKCWLDKAVRSRVCAFVRACGF